MQIPQLIVTILVTTVIVAAIIFATAASIFPRTAEAHAFGNWHGAGGGLGGWHGRHRGYGGGDPCARLDLPVGKLAGVMVEDHLKLTADQRKLLEPMLATLEGWQSDAKAQCTALTHDDIPGSLKAMESMLRLSADRIAELQPAWDTFHASLDDTQRAHIAQAMQRRHGHPTAE